MSGERYTVRPDSSGGYVVWDKVNREEADVAAFFSEPAAYEFAAELNEEDDS